MRNRLNDKMAKQDSPSSIKQKNSPSGPNDLSDLVQIADEALKQKSDGLAELAPADLEANAKTQRFVNTLAPDGRSKFFAMMGNDDFFKMFKSYTSGSEDNADQSPPARYFERNDSADDDKSETGAAIRYSSANDAEKAWLYEEILKSKERQAAKEKI